MGVMSEGEVWLTSLFDVMNAVKFGVVTLSFCFVLRR
jgi:hypothetical protein